MRIYDILPVGEETTRPGGYFRPAEGEKGRQELARFYHREQARGLASLRKLAAVGAALAQCGDQTTLDPPGDGTRRTSGSGLYVKPTFSAATPPRPQ